MSQPTNPPIEVPLMVTEADLQTIITALQFTDARCLTATPAERELENRIIALKQHYWPKPHVTAK